ncbi:MAG: threonylcarbamoyl-AMP synthase, partial [Candidatus Levybacteria bacterium]|nr:threonylcarbamoyl-AMP synthase [Candidatus Levybacteria bacterium]
MKNNIIEAIQVFNQGGIVIFPTDTAFGIGCRVDNEVAIQRLYTIRKRPLTQASSLLVANVDMAKEYLTGLPNDVTERLVKSFWPGGLTIVLQSRTDKIPDLVRGGGDTIGIRMPDHTELLSIITGVGVPILGPSANFHGEKTPFRQQDLNPELIRQVDYVVEGICKQNQASTVIDCTT